MISITNVSPKDSPVDGTHQYVVQVNGALITTFEHDRAFNGLAQCLRDAADAVDRKQTERVDFLLAEFIKHDKRDLPHV